MGMYASFQVKGKNFDGKSEPHMFLLDDGDALIEEKIADFGLIQRVQDGKPMVV